ncbi:MAG: hypothetical protein HUK22_02045, partial [Thermoguttaceae bacterium]|nr:hypothetical protein [Thermoguttaceae bacterium]
MDNTHRICGAVWTTRDGALSADYLANLVEGNVVAGRLTPDAAAEEKGVVFSERRDYFDPSGALQTASIYREGSAERGIWIAFNGEIYNARALREDLARRGRAVTENADPAAILGALYQESRDKDACANFLLKLNGEFSVAIFDAERRRVFIARDRLGVKPLFYRAEANRFIFASDLRLISRLPNVSRELDLTALRHYLVYQYVPYPRTIFHRVSKLPPASYAIWEEGKDLAIGAYWRPEEIADFDENADFAGSKYAPGKLDALCDGDTLGAARFELD